MSSVWNIILLTLLVSLIPHVTAKTIHSTEGETKVIEWTMNPIPGGFTVSILHPSGEVLYLALGKNIIPGTGSIAGRVSNTGNTNTDTGHIKFTLSGISASDAGDYKTLYQPTGSSELRQVGAQMVVNVKPSMPVLTVITTPVIGQNMNLNCTASSNSKPDGQLMKYNWYINNADLPADSRYVTTGSHLQVNNIQRSDRDSTFTCKGYEISSILSDASDVYIPDITYGPGSVTLSPNTTQYDKKENDNIGTIKCSADCNPPCIYQWKFNGKTNSGQSNSLTLNGIQPGQAGSYLCTATNDHGSNDSQTITVTVKHGPRTVKLLPIKQSYMLVEGTQNTLGPITCSADCNPPCTYQWSRDGTVVKQTAVLELTGATRADDGTYICNATNSYGNMLSSQVSATVQYKPESIKLQPSNLSYVLMESERLAPITCSATCKPDCTYKWRRNNVDIYQGNVLDLSITNRNDTGNYTCEASNEHGGIASSGINVDVEYPPDAVTITPQTTTYNIVENTPLNIACNALCKPNCTFQWRVNGATIRNTGAVLSISAVQRTESGNYSCLAQNKYGHKHIDVNVSVEYPPGPVNLAPLQLQYTPLEHIDTLGPITCESDCKPRCNYGWEYNGGQLSDGALLSIQDIDRDHTGTYRCNASNKYSHSYSKNIDVTVQYPPENTYIHTNIAPGNVKENDTLSVICTTKSVPSSIIRIWFEGADQQVVNQTTSTLQTNYTKTAECLDTGKYFCDAKNKFGNSTSNKTSVNVLCSPRPGTGIKPQNTVSIGDKESLNIIGTLISYPQPEISWTFRKDGSNDSTHIGSDTAVLEIEMATNNVIYNFRLKKNQTGVADFGDYIMNASNPYGSVILTFHVVSKRSPDPPYNLSLSCDTTEARIEWISNFNGGVSQNFIINVNKAQNVQKTYTVQDKGVNQPHQQIVTNLNPNTKYNFHVNAKNLIGSSDFPTPIFCTTRQSAEEPGSSGALIGGVVGGIAFVLIIIIIVLAIVLLRKRRKSKKDESTELMNRRGKPLQDDPDDGIRRNILYESAGPFLERQNDTAAECQYAAVDKSAKKKDNPADVYAVVEKKGKKQNTKGEVYENFGGDFEDEYANANIEPSGSGAVGGADNDVAPSRRKNKDGLVYVDVVIGNTGKGKKNGIHGIEKRVDYVDIDFSRRADPLPSDDEEDDDVITVQANV